MTVLAYWPMEIDKATCMVEVVSMASERLVIPGIVKNGLVVLQSDTPLPDGVHVDIVFGSADIPPELQAELAQWEKASDEVGSMIRKEYFIRYSPKA
jgi:hypothetical protein